MDDFPGLLARDFGFRPQGKSAPMAASKGSVGGGGGSLNFGIGSGVGDNSSFSSSSSNLHGKSGWNSKPVGGSSFLDDHEGLFGGGSNTGGSQKTTTTTKDFGGGYDDVFGGPPKSTMGMPSSSSFDYDSIFQGGSTRKVVSSSSSSLPVYDKPVYDDDIFDGIPGLKNMSSSSVKYDDVFTSSSSPPKQGGSPLYDDLLGNLGKTQPSILKKNSSGKKDVDESSFDDLIPGFGGRRSPPPPPKDRGTTETNQAQQSTVSSAKSTSSVMGDPFVGLESTTTPVYASSGLFTDPLEQIGKPSNSGSTKSNASSVSGGLFDDMNPLAGLGKSVPSFSSEMNDRVKDKSPQRTGPKKTTPQNFAGKEPSESTSQRSVPVDNYPESQPMSFEMPSISSDSNKSFGRNDSRHSFVNANNPSEVDMSPKSEDNSEAADDIWLTVSEIPLFTQPTSAPPPSRPPPRPTQFSNGARAASSKKVNEFSSQHFSQDFQSPKSGPGSVRSPGVSSINELEDFAMGKPQNNADEHGDVLSSDEELEMNSAAASAAAMKEAMEKAASAAAMKEAMEKAQAKFKHAKEVRERENAKVGRNRVPGQQDEKVMQDAQERELREKQAKLDLEREQREREEREREQRKLEKERERVREIEREREKARQAVERATREARDRAAADARQKSERAAVEKAHAEARQRAERAAVQRAQNEARERAAAAAAKAEAEVRLRAERAAAERASTEARERAANAKDSQQKNENDLESFFSMGVRPTSAPKSRNTTSNSAFDAQSQNKVGPDNSQRSSAGTATSTGMRKASSTTNIVDDLSSIFGAAPTSAGEFQEIDGESEERRRARMARNQKTHERALKALADKNERDLQTQREQAERHRVAETLDIEIKRWAAGKETNLRALLSTLQYVLWPECGWQPVSLTDLITAASVKKVYRKATLCIHPDKVQQKGANIQQKYIAEKVFDLLKEAWNKFNSEELF